MDSPSPVRRISCAGLWVSANTLALLVGRSRKTIFRWTADGTITRREAKQGAQYHLQDVLKHVPLEITDRLCRVIREVDKERPSALCQLGLRFLQANFPKLAIPCLQQAAKGQDKDAMAWLSQCYQNGQGVPKDLFLAAKWLGEAACHGHPAAQRVVAQFYGIERTEWNEDSSVQDQKESLQEAIQKQSVMLREILQKLG